MTVGILVLSVVMGIAYGWASAYWSGENRLFAPQILHSDLVNILISFGTVATIIISGVNTGSFMNSVWSLLIIFVSGFVTNFRINGRIQKIIERRQFENSESDKRII